MSEDTRMHEKAMWFIENNQELAEETYCIISKRYTKEYVKAYLKGKILVETYVIDPIADAVAEKIVNHGKMDCNLDYRPNIDGLIKEVCQLGDFLLCPEVREAFFH